MSITEERYARSTRSSHLEVTAKHGDIDTIIAAGMAETLGVLLSRLRSEWDAESGEAAQYHRAHVEWVRRADEQAALARKEAEAATQAKCQAEMEKDPAKIGRLHALVVAAEIQATRHVAEANRFRGEAARELVTGRALVLMHLRSLGPTKQAIYNFAYRQASRRGCVPDDPRLLDLCGTLLDVWLDRRCHHCGGRGFNGGYREPQVHCRPCRGTGSRRVGLLHEDVALQAYGLWLLNVLDAKSTSSMGQIGRKTRANA